MEIFKKTKDPKILMGRLLCDIAGETQALDIDEKGLIIGGLGGAREVYVIGSVQASLIEKNRYYPSTFTPELREGYNLVMIDRYGVRNSPIRLVQNIKGRVSSSISQ